MTLKPRVLWSMLVLLSANVFSAEAGTKAANDYFVFNLPRAAGYVIDAGETQPATAATGLRVDWLKAWPDEGSSDFVLLGSRVVVQLEPGTDLRTLLAGRRLEW